MDDNENALARLFERLSGVVGVLAMSGLGQAAEPVGVAARIVAELAKVDDNMPGASCLTAALMRCRAIAKGTD